MANQLIPTAEMDLGGKTRTLRMDLNALIDFERATGKSLLDGTINVTSLSMADLRALVWACAVQVDESITEKEVGSWMGLGTISKLSAVLTNLFIDAMPKSDGEADRPLEPATAEDSTG